MCVCVCVCVCVFVFVFVCGVFTCMRACVCVCVYVSLYFCYSKFKKSDLGMGCIAVYFKQENLNTTKLNTSTRTSFICIIFHVSCSYLIYPNRINMGN